ncbi:MAG: ABC transporter substrate-binding protein [Herpetosiphonaceae bacterium]|nr:ABC transporter substrate-binding protein [Herpetosiphonaceae bacterium]
MAQTETSPATAGVTVTAATAQASVSAATTPAASTASPAENFDLNNWASVLAAAKGKTVNWYMYGGADSINRFVDAFYGKALKDHYGVTLNRVPVADTVDAVNQVLSEKQAGKDLGAVDVIWINGENFASLKQANMLYDGWNRQLPNSKLVNYDNKALNLDFGIPIGGMESPWSSAELQFIYDEARTKASDLPRSYAALKEYACDHKGRVTYIAPGPGAFQGTRFVKQALYELSGGPEQWSGTFNQALWDQWSPKLWQFLNDLKPCLWRQGATYAKDENELHSLFANNEIDFSSTQAIAGAGPLIKDGKVPPTARAFVFDKNMIGDFNYLGIPSNAPNKAAALVLANLILEPDLQAAQILPNNGFGLGYGIDVTKVTDANQTKALQDAASKLGPSATDANQLAKVLVSDMPQQYQNLVEQEWQKKVLQAK